MTALWVAYALTFIHALIIIGIPSTLWPPEQVVVNQLVFEIVSAAVSDKTPNYTASCKRD